MCGLFSARKMSSDDGSEEAALTFVNKIFEENDARRLCSLFKFSPKDLQGLPSKKLRCQGMAADHQRFPGLVKIFRHFMTKIANFLFPHNPELLINTLFDDHTNELGRLQDRYNKLIEFISQANANSKKKSNVRRITRAILTNSLTHKELASMKFSGKFGHICALHSGTNFKAAFNDAKLMVTGKDVVKVVHRRAKFTPEQANDLVKFI